MSQNKTASRKDDRQLRGKEARPPAKDHETKMTDGSNPMQKSKDGEKKDAGKAPLGAKADGKPLGSRAGKNP